MKLVIQRVSEAIVSTKEKIVNKIDLGYAILVGFNEFDTIEEVDKACHKINNLRLFDDDEGKINLSIKSVGGEILLISQFTLYGDVRSSNRPSFTKSMKKEEAKILYQYFIKTLNEKYEIVTKEGAFGEMMSIKLILDGPVTLNLEY